MDRVRGEVWGRRGSCRARDTVSSNLSSNLPSIQVSALWDKLDHGGLAVYGMMALSTGYLLTSICLASTARVSL